MEEVKETHKHTFYIYFEENDDGSVSVFLVDTSVYTFLCSATPCFYIEQVHIKTPINLTDDEEEGYLSNYHFYEGYISKYNLPNESELIHIIDIEDETVDCWDKAKEHFSDHRDLFLKGN